MKKYITILTMTFIISTANATYTSCVGGTEITSNVYNTSGAPAKCNALTCPSPAKKFCKSNLTMNWASAFTWCQSNGGTLASFASMCPEVPAEQRRGVEGACPALQGKGSGLGWSSLGKGTSYAFVVELANGGIRGNDVCRFRAIGNHCDAGAYAICE